MSSPLTSPHQQQERTTNWTAIGIGVAVVIVIVAVIWLFGRGSNVPRQVSYATNMKFSDLKMSTAQNFMGGKVTYLEGKITNNGPQTVTHADVQAEFRNSLSEVVGREDVPVMVTQERPGYSDTVDLSAAPIPPGGSREFRLTFEHVSADWNQEYPQLTLVDIRTK
jgi:hypothetical protein